MEKVEMMTKEAKAAGPEVQAMIDCAHRTIADQLTWLRSGCDAYERELRDGRCWTQGLGQHVERLAEQVGILGALRDQGYDVKPRG